MFDNAGVMASENYILNVLKIENFCNNILQYLLNALVKYVQSCILSKTLKHFTDTKILNGSIHSTFLLLFCSFSMVYKWPSFHLGLRSRVALLLESRIPSLSLVPLFLWSSGRLSCVCLVTVWGR